MTYDTAKQRALSVFCKGELNGEFKFKALPSISPACPIENNLLQIYPIDTFYNSLEIVCARVVLTALFLQILNKMNMEQ
jgi:hypothetical protein